MAKKEQRLTFVVGKTSDGRMKVEMLFYPPLAKSKEAFEAMPMETREMQNLVADAGRYAMNRLFNRGGNDETLQQNNDQLERQVQMPVRDELHDDNGEVSARSKLSEDVQTDGGE